MKLGNYKGLHAPKPDFTVSENDIKQVLQRKRREWAIVYTNAEGKRMMEFQALDDDFAKDYSEYDTLDEWKDAIREQLEERRAESAWEKLSRQLLKQVIDNSDIPVNDDFVMAVAEDLFDDFLDELEDNNITLQLYCDRNHITEDQIQSDKEEEALEAIQANAVLHAIAETEGLAVSPEELAEQLQVLADENDMDAEEFLAELEEEEVEAISEELLADKAMAVILDSAVLE